MSSTQKHGLDNRVWQPVPGWAGGEFFPIITKPGFACSNSYLIDTQYALIVIDPGADPAQTDLINRTLAERPATAGRPVLVVLTHCHQDHSQEAGAITLTAGGPNLLFAEASGADALQNGDRERTQAEMFPEHPAVSTRRADVRLFDAAGDGERVLCDVGSLELRIGAPCYSGPQLPLCQSIAVGGGNYLHFYRTPGHSPCSICIQAGHLLFVGDLPFAADPGLAGINGWSQADLLRSLSSVKHVMHQQNIRVCCPGHGYAIPAEAMHKMLTAMKEAASSLEQVDVMDLSRVAMLREFVDELLEEAEYLFAVISGRLYAVSFHLTSLEESAEAQRFSGALDINGIDRVLSGFRAFHAEFRAAEQLGLSLVIKGVQTARAIERMFEAPKLQAVLEASLLRRATRLLSDYVTLVLGLRLAGEPTPDVNLVLGELVHGLDIRNLDGEAFIDSADDPEAYLMGLVARLAFPPAFRDVRIEFDGGAGVGGVSLGADRLGDLAMTLLESVAGAGNPHITVRSRREGDRIRIDIGGAMIGQALSARRFDLSNRILAPHDGRLEFSNPADGGECFVIDLPAVDHLPY